MTVSSLFTTMAGLEDLTAEMQATASNLANLQTPGYAAVQAQAVSAPYEGSNAPPGADVVALVPGPNTQAGPLTHTGDALDVGLNGDAWLEVQTANGNVLTRDGSLHINNAGILTDSAGEPILSTSSTPISVPQLAQLSIGADGTISGVPAATPSSPAQKIGQIRMVATPSGGMTDLGNSQYLPPAGATLADAKDGALVQNYLNASTVDPTQTIMTMISNTRSYQAQTALMRSQSTGGDGLNTLLAQG